MAIQLEAWELYIKFAAEQQTPRETNNFRIHNLSDGRNFYTKTFPEPRVSMESLSNKIIEVNLQFLQARQIPKWWWDLSTEIIIFQMPSQEENTNSIILT